MKKSEIPKALQKVREYFNSGVTLDLNHRIDNLKSLKQAIELYQNKIQSALKTDLNKSAFEAFETEIGITLEEISHTILKLKHWARKRRVTTPIQLQPGRSFIKSEPYGVVLIMAPWNYPFQLLFSPLTGALAAGNCCVLKSSVHAPATSKVMGEIISDIFPAEEILFIPGQSGVSELLLKHKYDYIFFTGSTNTGRLVMSAAAEHLTPVTLELGGKNPCIVDKISNIKSAARRIAWGKFLNAGQTCVAPDYLIVHDQIKEELIETIIKYITEFFGTTPEKSQDYGRIINKKHFERISAYINQGKLVSGGNTIKAELYIEPTIIEGPKKSASVMNEEIFGPVLPIISYDNIDSVISELRSKPKPLALYLFTDDHETESKILNNLSFGGGCINDTVIHLANPYLPLGGVGLSGIGSYHGKKSFETFSHFKSIYKRGILPEFPVRFPPYSDKKMKLIRFLFG